MSLPFSDYQLAIFGAVELGMRSVLVRATAGAGKTTTLVEAAKRGKSKGRKIFLAFNKRIVEELRIRLPQSVECATFNSCGYKAWRSYVGRYVMVDPQKTWKLTRELLCEDDVEIYGAFIKKMVSLAKSAGIGGHLAEDTLANWHQLRDHHNVYIPREDSDYNYGLTLAQIVLRESIKRGKSVIDFDDQLYLPYLFQVSFPRYDQVFVDEGQDTNEVQVEILKKLRKPNGIVVVVGDPFQAIYGFRGADHNALSNLEQAFSCVTLPLSISYRCSKAVVAEAQKYSSDIEPFAGAPEGQVVSLPKYNATDFQQTDAILCRNNAPLIKMAYGFIRRGISINMLGKDLGAGLKIFIQKMRANDVDDLLDKMNDWLSKERARLIERGQEDKLEALLDKVECIKVIVGNLSYDNRSIQALQDEIDFLFREGSRGITLSSVHKAKGDEWDRVFILDFHALMPSKYAKKDWMMIQENNLIFVAITRAKHYLGFIQSECFADEDLLLQEELRNRFQEEKATRVKHQPKPIRQSAKPRTTQTKGRIPKVKSSKTKLF